MAGEVGTGNGSGWGSHLLRGLHSVHERRRGDGRHAGRQLIARQVLRIGVASSGSIVIAIRLLIARISLHNFFGPHVGKRLGHLCRIAARPLSKEGQSLDLVAPRLRSRLTREGGQGCARHQHGRCCPEILSNNKPGPRTGCRYKEVRGGNGMNVICVLNCITWVHECKDHCVTHPLTDTHAFQTKSARVEVAGDHGWRECWPHTETPHVPKPANGDRRCDGGSR